MFSIQHAGRQANDGQITKSAGSWNYAAVPPKRTVTKKATPSVAVCHFPVEESKDAGPPMQERWSNNVRMLLERLGCSRKRPSNDPESRSNAPSYGSTTISSWQAAYKTGFHVPKDHVASGKAKNSNGLRTSGCDHHNHKQHQYQHHHDRHHHYHFHDHHRHPLRPLLACPTRAADQAL